MKLTARLAGLLIMLGFLVATAVPGQASPAAVPARFRAASISWLQARRGWLLGTAPCGRKSCTDVLATGNGGTSWALAGSLATPIATQSTPSDVGVSSVTFATPSVGWAYGPALYRTANGGRTWQARPLPGHGHQVVALAASSNATYLVVSPCKEFALSCVGLHFSFWRASLTGTSWTQVKLTLPSLNSASLGTFGPAVYLVDTGAPGTLYYSATGRSFAARLSPCRKNQLDLLQAVPTSATSVALLCDGQPQIGQAIKTVYRSANTGRTDTSAGTTSPPGENALLAASPSGNLAVGAWSTGSVIYVNDGHQTKWSATLVLTGNAPAGFSGLTFVSNQVAWTVWQPATQGSMEAGRVYVSRNGGRRWTAVTLRPSER
jgi:hypothetical protein